MSPTPAAARPGWIHHPDHVVQYASVRCVARLEVVGAYFSLGCRPPREFEACSGAVREHDFFGRNEGLHFGPGPYVWVHLSKGRAGVIAFPG